MHWQVRKREHILSLGTLLCDSSCKIVLISFRFLVKFIYWDFYHFWKIIDQVTTLHGRTLYFLHTRPGSRQGMTTLESARGKSQAPGSAIDFRPVSHGPHLLFSPGPRTCCIVGSKIYVERK